MPYVPPGYILINVAAGVNAAIGPGGVPVSYEYANVGQIWALGGLPAIYPETIYPAIVADLVAEANQIKSYVGTVRDQLVTDLTNVSADNASARAAIQAQLTQLKAFDDATMAGIRAQLTGLPEAIAQDLAPLLNQDVGTIVADIQDSEQRDQGLYAQLAQELGAGFDAVATDAEQHYAALAGAIAELKATVTAEGALTEPQLQADLNTTAQWIVDYLAGAIAGGSSADLPAMQEIARQLTLIDGDLVPWVKGAIDRQTDEVSASTLAQLNMLRPFLQALNIALGGISGHVGAIAPTDVATPIDKLGTTWSDALDKNWERTKARAAEMGFDPETIDQSIQHSAMPSLRTLGGLASKALIAVPVLVYWLKEITGVDLMQKATEEIPWLVPALEGFAKSTGDAVMGTINAIHKPMRSVMEGGATLIFTELENELDALGRANPDNAMQAAARFLSIAGGFGMASHLAAVAAEKRHVAKNLGLSQLAAFLADMSAFGAVARDSIGQQLDAAVRIPAHRGALARFRPELPDGRAFEESYFARELAADEFDQYYGEKGWSEEWIEPWRLAIWRKLSPRQLAQVIMDGELDVGWATQMVQRSGYNDEDTPRIVKGILAQAQKTARGGVVTATIANYVEGLISLEDLRGFLQNVPIDAPTAQLYIEEAQHKRYQADAKARRSELEQGAKYGLIDLATLDTELAGVGYDPGARALAVERVRTYIDGSAFRKATTAAEAALRKIQTAEVTAALDGYQRYLYAEGELVAQLESAGADPTLATALMHLAQIKRLPVPKQPEVLTEAAQQQEDLKLITSQITTYVEKGNMTASAGTAALVQAGLAPREASLEVALAVAKLAQKVRPPKPAKITPEQRTMLTTSRDLSIQMFRDGKITTTQLHDRLVAADTLPPAAANIVAREVLRKDQLAQQAAASAAHQDLVKIRAALKSDALTLYRDGAIDEGELLNQLLAAGEPAEAALALVEREVVAAASRAAAKKPVPAAA